MMATHDQRKPKAMEQRQLHEELQDALQLLRHNDRHQKDEDTSTRSPRGSPQTEVAASQPKQIEAMYFKSR